MILEFHFKDIAKAAGAEKTTKKLLKHVLAFAIVPVMVRIWKALKP